MSLYRPDSQTYALYSNLGREHRCSLIRSNKAVADGAVSFYLDHFVSSRTARFSYGSLASVIYNNRDSEHRIRSHKRFTRPSGDVAIPGYFCVNLKRGTQVSEVQEFTRTYLRERSSKAELSQVSVGIIVYRGSLSSPTWVDGYEAEYTTLCSVYADTSALTQSLKEKEQNGRKFFRINFDVILLFGLTELQAQIRWFQGGIEKRSPATIVYDEEM